MLTSPCISAQPAPTSATTSPAWTSTASLAISFQATTIATTHVARPYHVRLTVFKAKTANVTPNHTASNTSRVVTPVCTNADSTDTRSGPTTLHNTPASNTAK